MKRLSRDEQVRQILDAILPMARAHASGYALSQSLNACDCTGEMWQILRAILDRGPVTVAEVCERFKALGDRMKDYHLALRRDGSGRLDHNHKRWGTGMLARWGDGDGSQILAALDALIPQPEAQPDSKAEDAKPQPAAVDHDGTPLAVGDQVVCLNGAAHGPQCGRNYRVFELDQSILGNIFIEGYGRSWNADRFRKVNPADSTAVDCDGTPLAVGDEVERTECDKARMRIGSRHHITRVQHTNWIELDDGDSSGWISTCFRKVVPAEPTAESEPDPVADFKAALAEAGVEGVEVHSLKDALAEVAEPEPTNDPRLSEIWDALTDTCCVVELHDDRSWTLDRDNDFIGDRPIACQSDYPNLLTAIRELTAPKDPPSPMVELLDMLEDKRQYPRLGTWGNWWDKLYETADKARKAMDATKESEAK